MAAGVIRNFLIQTPTPAYFPLIFQHSPCMEDDDVEMLEETPEAKEDEEEREVDEEEEEEEEDEESEAQEEEEGCLDAFLNPTHYALDVTNQLLRFADLISQDVQRYFGRCSGDREACDIYSDSVSVTTSGRLRYYDDLLKIARAGSPEEQDSRLVTGAEDQGVRVAKGNSSLGPLAELFNQRGQSQGRGRPMIKRLLPLSFWSEPIPCCSLVSFSSTPDVTHTHSDTPLQDSTHTDSDTHAHHQSTHADSDTHAHHQSTHADSDTHMHQSTHTDSDTHMHQSTHTDSDTHMHQSTHTDSDTHAHQSTHTDSDTHAHCNPLPHHGTHALDNTQLDFSDLLAYWDPNPELTHTLTENTHMQH